MQDKIWKIKEYNEEIVQKISQDLGIDLIIARLLNVKGITNKAEGLNFINPDLIDNLHNPFLFKDMEKAVNRIKKAIDACEKISIFGDRDVDGISSSALLYKALKKLNALVEVYVPSGNDGYGLIRKLLQDLKKKIVI